MRPSTVIASALFAALTAVSGVALAKDNPTTQPINTPSQVSRAEVLADLQIYRESGLAAVEQSESYGYDIQRAEQARAKYAQLRRSPYFASLVQQYAGKTPAPAVAAVAR